VWGGVSVWHNGKEGSNDKKAMEGGFENSNGGHSEVYDGFLRRRSSYQMIDSPSDI